MSPSAPSALPAVAATEPTVSPNIDTGTDAKQAPHGGLVDGMPFSIDALASLSTGIGIAVIFNPVDRALYLAVKSHRSFFLRANFAQPFQGLSQAILHRTLSHGAYYFYQDLLRIQLSQKTQISNFQLNILVGACAGALNGATLNPIANIKYQVNNCLKKTSLLLTY